MPYVAPTPEDFAARFAALATVTEETIDYWLAEAALECANWPEDMRAKAELYYAAHMIVELGAAPDMAAQGITQFRSGDFSVSYGKASERTGISSTAYGREFARLARVAFAGPRLVQ